MALNTYISKVKGEKQGVFKGGAVEQPVAKKAAPVPSQTETPVVAADTFEAKSPRDPASGQATGKR